MTDHGYRGLPFLYVPDGGEALELHNYLPLSFKTRSEQVYIAFLAYQMLTMSFVYFNIWQIKQTEPGDFDKGLIGFGKDVEKGLLAATSPLRSALCPSAPCCASSN